MQDGAGTANTALAFHHESLLALHEGDMPYRVRTPQIRVVIACFGIIVDSYDVDYERETCLAGSLPVPYNTRMVVMIVLMLPQVPFLMICTLYAIICQGNAMQTCA